MIVVSILLLILILGLLISVHELGHFSAAKLCGIRVDEFAIGMGPKIWKKQKGETLYSLRAFPIGGFCAMAEDEASEDPRSFRNARRWKRFVVLFAGSFMNFLLGFILLIVMFLPVEAVVEPVITNLESFFEYSGENGLQTGDRIEKINGNSIYNYQDVTMFLELGLGKSYSFDVVRDGEKVHISDLPMKKTIVQSQGKQVERFGINFGSVKELGFGGKLREAFYSAIDYVRIVRVSIGELIGGRAKASDLMGPVGMGGAVNNIIANETAPVEEKALNVLNLAALIAINLAVMNLLPLPALDGGRILFLLIESIRRKPIKAEVEGYIHAAFMFLFFALMIFIFFNDILRLFGVSL